MRERNAMQVAYARTKGKRYAETFRCPGGALCLDFCNSGQGIRGSRQEEWIPTYADLVDWLEAAGALTESQALRLRTGGAEAPQAAQQLFERAIAFREALARVLLAGLGAIALVPLVAWASPLLRLRTLDEAQEPRQTESVAEELAG